MSIFLLINLTFIICIQGSISLGFPNPDIDWDILLWPPSSRNSVSIYYLQLLIPEQSVEDHTFFYLYTRSNMRIPEQLFVDKTLSIESSHFNASKKTMIVIHGYDNSYLGTTAQDPKNEYLKNNDYNVILLDYGDINRNSITYMMTVAYSYRIGRYLGRFLNFLIKSGVNQDDIHITGHSLGAHIAGFAGKVVKEDGNLIGRITALEPVYIGFQGNARPYRLTSDDAKFTDCIFTTFSAFGTNVHSCQANYFPNGVRNIQPPCGIYTIEAGCAHSIVVDYFVESINPTSQFTAQQCVGIPINSFLCRHTRKSRMGEFADPNVFGTFYLETNSQPPYSKG